MRCVSFIPARGGSKRIHHKNLREVGGVSLVARAALAAFGAGIDATISTDDPQTYIAAANETRRTNRLWVAELHERPPQLATDHAQIESAMQHWWHRLDDKPDAIVLLQPTSPFRTAEHVREALRLLEATGADSVVGVTVGHEHHFAGRLKPRDGLMSKYGDIGAVFGAPGHFYDWQPFRDVTADRPRTQDLAPRGSENGSLYAFTRAHWERTGNRLGGHMVALPMTRWEGLDVDEEIDVTVANALVAAGVCK